MRRFVFSELWWRVRALAYALSLLCGITPCVFAQKASVSAFDAAHFRIWGYIPYWDDTKVGGFATSGMYSHVSDVLFFGSARPDSTGAVTNLYPNTTATLRSQAQTYGFNLHLSFMAVSGGQSVSTTWSNIVNSPTARAKFVTDVKALMDGGAGTADDMKGFNFDWERPATDSEWGNYTQLARELRAALNPTGTEGREVSVCDYGSTDSDWDDTSLFDAKVYDQLMMMVYHIGATSSGSWANTKLALTGQGASKAFSNDQIAVGVGTWGTGIDPDGNGPLGKPPTVTLPQIITANGGSLPYDQASFTGTIGSSTGTWNIESRKQVREKTQLALDRGMPGMFTWDITYDATSNLGLHRVMHHYMAVKRDVPDLNLSGKVDATDATTLANNMGMSLTNTGMTSAAQFDAFYLNGNWEKGDHDGNGFVNQADADWLANRYAALGVNLPDRLAYSGTFESLSSSLGLSGRWRAGRTTGGKLLETSNFKQEANGFLTWSGQGRGATFGSSSFVTIRNQNATEQSAGQNALARTMQVSLAANIDLSQNQDTYFKFTVRENTAPLLAGQLASNNRTLSLDFLDASGASQFDFALRGLQQQFAIDSVADAGGQDVSTGGFTSSTTYLFVGKISGNGSGANTLQASIFPTGSVVANFTDPGFQWMLTANGSLGFDPVISALQFTTRAESNYTVSNIWIGNAATLLPPTRTSQGDFNQDGIVDASDYTVWRKSLGQTGANMPADGNGNNQIDSDDLLTWRFHFGQNLAGAGSGLDSPAGVPEPKSFALAMLCLMICVAIRAR
jgi:hypothetical protein